MTGTEELLLNELRRVGDELGELREGQADLRVEVAEIRTELRLGRGRPVPAQAVAPAVELAEFTAPAPSAKGKAFAGVIGAAISAAVVGVIQALSK
jgi:hypothetical protein